MFLAEKCDGEPQYERQFWPQWLWYWRGPLTVPFHKHAHCQEFLSSGNYVVLPNPH
jgi:hypothetical protein